MSAQIYLTSILLILGTILLVFGMKYVSAAMQAWARARGEALSASAQSKIPLLLTSIQADNRQMLTRLAAIEKILKEVE
jgi:Sec-independent protein translocase protein TatA